jgi:hypothetical protein
MEHSDWDFIVKPRDFDLLRRDLKALTAKFRPLAAQWDRMSSEECYMIIVSGPTKVDLIFAGFPHQCESPWNVTAATLDQIDQHFWDWILWLVSKHERGERELVKTELKKMWEHLLRPMGVPAIPRAFEDAVDSYRGARDDREANFGIRLPRHLEAEVRPLLARV